MEVYQWRDCAIVLQIIVTEMKKTENTTTNKEFLSKLFTLGKQQDAHLEQVLNPNGKKYPRPIKR